MEETLTGFPLIFGLIASIIHVISGPDHLAAVSPIALHAKRRAWTIGLAWGIGHVGGMLLIGLLFYYFRNVLPIDAISDYSERIVGVLLIAIGIWALYKIIPKHHQHSHQHTHLDDDGNAFIHQHKHTHLHQHTPDKSEKQTWFIALSIGILHGLAGVSHIVSLLPTLAFANNYQAALYLVGFAGGTVVAMVAFAFALGLISKTATHDHKNTLLNWINGIAGIAAIVVGIIWITLTW